MQLWSKLDEVHESVVLYDWRCSEDCAVLVSGVVSAKVPSYIHPHTGAHTFLLIDGLESFPHRDMLCGMQCRLTTCMSVQCSVTLGRNQASNEQHSEV